MTKEVEMIINDIEEFGECYIGSFEIQGMAVVKRYNKVRKAFEKKHPNNTLAFNIETGMTWLV